MDRLIQVAHLRAEEGLYPSQLGQPVTAARSGVQHISHANVCLALEQLAEEKPDIVDKNTA